MIEFLLSTFIDWLEKWRNRESVKTLGAKRSSEWRKVRAEHLKKNPACIICGETKKNIEVHHIIPFNIDPTKELDPPNLETLCESGNNGIVCHRAIGHLGDYQSYNVSIREDAKMWKNKIKNRP